MKFFRLILVLCVLHTALVCRAQQISLNESRASIEKILEKLEKQSGYTFFYNSALFSGLTPPRITLHKVSLQEALDEILKDTRFTYSVVGKTVVIKASQSFSQPATTAFTLNGKVVDRTGSALAGVSVMSIQGDARRTFTTTAQGSFSIPGVTTDTYLLFSYVGFREKKILISTDSPVLVTLDNEDNQLDEIQVKAYSTTSRRLNTGNSYTLRAQDIAQSPAPSIFQIMQNRIPGLEVIPSTGQIGGSFEVRIRGLSGIKSEDPLYIVDGVSYPAGGKNLNPNGYTGALPTLENNRGRGSLAQLGGNALNYINPEDIESIDVLKDAEATSIYGSRGAYGVILITTKKGIRGNGTQPALNLSIDRGFSVTGTLPKMLSTADYLMIRKEAIKNDGLSIGPTDLDLNGTYPADAQQDWFKELLGTKAWQTRVHARYSGMTERTGYSFAGSFNKSGNVVRDNGSNEDGGFKLDLSTATSDRRFEINASALLNFTRNTMVPYDFSGDIALFRAPNAPSYFHADGTLDWSEGTNPYGYLNTDFKQDIGNLLGASTVIFRPVKGLSLKAQLGYNLLNGSELRQVSSAVFAPADPLAMDKANSSKNRFSIRTWTMEPFASYQTLLARGQITLTTGATLQDKLIDQSVMSGTGFPSDAMLNNPTAGATVLTRYNHVSTRYLGYFGSINYNRADRYIISASTRYDGSTKFAPASRFGWFGSVAGAYIFTQTRFFREKVPFLSFGKIRASYGSSGGDAIDNFLYLATYISGPDYLGDPTFLTGELANNSLHWEKNHKLDLSVSLGLFSDRLLFDAGYYRNKAFDILYGSPIPTVTGYPLVEMNSSAAIRNTGAEFSLSWENAKNRPLRWQISTVLTIPRSNLEAIPSYFLQPLYNFSLGASPLNVKSYNYQGVDPQTGRYRFITASGKQVSSVLELGPGDKTIDVEMMPRYFGSVSNSLRYKSFGLNFTVAVVNKTAKTFLSQAIILPGAYNFNLSQKVLQRWQKPGDMTDVPKPSTGFLGILDALAFSQSSGAYQRIYYLRMQNLALSYSLNERLLQRLHARSVKISLQGQNLFTLTNYADLDPENASLGQLSPLRTFNVELAVTF